MNKGVSEVESWDNLQWSFKDRCIISNLVKMYETLIFKGINRWKAS